jgi:hypothetical protein
MAFILSRLVYQPVYQPGQGATQFFNQANPEAAARLNAWTLSQPGVLGSDTYGLTLRSQVGHIMFDTMEHLNAYRTAAQSNADYQARDAYAQLHNFVVEESVTS